MNHSSLLEGSHYISCCSLPCLCLENRFLYQNGIIKPIFQSINPCVKFRLLTYHPDADSVYIDLQLICGSWCQALLHTLPQFILSTIVGNMCDYIVQMCKLRLKVMSKIRYVSCTERYKGTF